MARAIAEDGEGATKLVEVTVRGAPEAEIARDLARSVAGSNLVKAAIFGADPNWGRVLASIGARAGSRRYDIDPLRARVTIQGIVVFEGGAPTAIDPLALRAKMRDPQIAIDVQLAEGKEDATAWGCDLSYDYVKINADYTSLTASSPEGTVASDDRLTNYTPGFKRALLVEALSYISRFSGKRAVVKYGGAAMVKDSLKASFAADMNLLKSAGLAPIVVHGGGPEITHTLEKLGSKRSEFVEGVRITDAADLKVVEMVLTGKINTELVSLLNQRNAHAVGVSGKDAGAPPRAQAPRRRRPRSRHGRRGHEREPRAARGAAREGVRAGRVARRPRRRRRRGLQHQRRRRGGGDRDRAPRREAHLPDRRRGHPRGRGARERDRCA